MYEKSIISHFADGTVAFVRSMTIQDRYEHLVEGTRSAYSRIMIPEIQERKDVIDYLVEQRRPCGEFRFESEMVPEMWGDRYVGECFKEYMVTTRFYAYGDNGYTELSVIWDASKEDLLDLGTALENVTGTIEYRKYCKK